MFMYVRLNWHESTLVHDEQMLHAWKACVHFMDDHCAMLQLTHRFGLVNKKKQIY